MSRHSQVSNTTLPTVAPVFPTLSSHHNQNIDFRPLDETYGKNNKYVQKLMKIPSLKHFSNEKKCFQQLVPYYLNPSINSVCRSASDLIDFFNHNKKDLFFSCQDPQPYSHCQEFYVVTYDTMKDECSMIQWRMNARRSEESHVWFTMVVLSHMLDNPNDFDDITLITILTLVRKDRLPYLMKRWKHRINMVIFASENEIDELREVIDSYKSYKRITFILYIVKSMMERNPFIETIQSFLSTCWET